VSLRQNLLFEQVKQLAMESGGRPPTAQQWSKLVKHIEHAFNQADKERSQLEHSQENSSREMQVLYERIAEAQRIAGLGNWSYDRIKRSGEWSDECFRIFGIDPSLPIPSYRELSRQVYKDDRIQVKDRTDAALHDGKDYEMEFRFVLPNGEIRWIRSIGHPIKNNAGKVIRLLGTVMDVTRRKLVELRQSMEHSITRLLAESDSPVEVMPEIIQTICETMGSVCGALWTLNKQDGSLHRAATWSIPDPVVEAYFRVTEDVITSPSKAGLISRTLQIAKPVWLSDFSHDPHYLHASGIKESGLRAGFTFPIQVGGEVLGVMEFFSQQAQKIEPEMLQSAHFIGRHIGQFFQRKQAEDALKESEEHFRSLVEQASDSFYVHDTEGRFIDVNQRGCEGLGYKRKELLSMSVKDIDIDLSMDELKNLPGQISAKAPISRESRYRRKDGSIYPVEIRTGPIEINGRQHLLSLVRDVTERKEMQDHIQHLAYHDSLTDLPNRAMFNRHLSHAIAQARRHRKKLAVLFIDLDRFKIINDTLGHDAGDRLLQEMALRLSSSLRNTDLVARMDSSNDLVARLGGDEFVVLIEDASDPSHISHIAHKILTNMVEEFFLNGQLVHITASIGISIFPDDGRDEFTLMKHADIAMYRAKEKGKNNYQFYSAQMSLHTANQLALESNLRRAMERNELELHYQAKVEARTGRIIGVESLVRWNHPDLGLLLPDEFIPLAEEIGLVTNLSKWVLTEACRQNLRWQEQGLPPLLIAVNMSARQFEDDDVLADTARILEETDMDPALLEVEITESMMMYNPDKTIQILSELRKMGIRIAIDDFGIGYSSLSHLKQFPIDIIKIDRSFIQDIPGDEADEAITAAIIAMGKSLKITVVAEGVETARQLEFLSNLNCQEIQGYLFSKPLPADEFAALMWSNLEKNTYLPVLENIETK
jgi:diguanylate cyclase (GGDEF)-like protein/PAS domain S-box-containing protein